MRWRRRTLDIRSWRHQLHASPLAALTDEDKRWLQSHGWRNPADALLRSGAVVTMANVEYQQLATQAQTIIRSA